MSLPVLNRIGNLEVLHDVPGRILTMQRYKKATDFITLS